MLEGSLSRSVIRAGLCRQASPVRASVFGRKFHAFSQPPVNAGTFSGLVKSSRIETLLQSSMLGNLGMKLGLVRVAEIISLPCTLSFRSSLHSGERQGVEAGKNPTSTEQESGNGIKGNPVPEFGAVMNNTIFGVDQFLNRAKIPRVITRLPLNNEAGGNLNFMDYLRGPPLNSEAGGNLNTVDYLRGLARKGDETGRLPLNSEAGRNLNSVDYLRGVLRESDETGRSPLPPPVPEAGRTPRPVDGLHQGRGYGLIRGGHLFYDQPQLESNADIVHIKLMRNNSYVTLTDHKGNRKVSVSAGQVAAKGDKPGRYAGEAAAEYMGRVVKQMKIRSVVVKVSGLTFFKRKKDSILAFKDGYTHSRGDVNPIVYVEDTTRKPHNGCRRRKQRRI